MADADPDLTPGTIVWVRFDSVEGREQSGHRPALVVASVAYLELVDTLAIAVPITSVDRRWDNHVEVFGMPRPSWAMTEQVRRISRSRIISAGPIVDERTLESVSEWIRDFLI